MGGLPRRQTQRFASKSPPTVFTVCTSSQEGLFVCWAGGTFHLKFQQGELQLVACLLLSRIKELEPLRSTRLENGEGVRLHLRSLYVTYFDINATHNTPRISHRTRVTVTVLL